MSRIGRLPVAIPAGVTVEVAANNVVTVTGPKGTLVKELPVEMEIKVEGEEVVVTRPSDLKKMKSLHGLTRTLINNMVVGVTNGYEKVLEVNGVGYRASKSGNKLTLNLGYSHPVEMIDPEGVETVLEGQNKITVKGIDKEKVGQFAAEIRDKRRPEPYKMVSKKSRSEVRRKKHMKLRNRFSGTAERPRLAVFRSNNHMYAQIIDDTVGNTLVAASTLEKDVKAELEKTNNVEAAAYLGKVIAEKAKAKGITDVVFDRGGFIYQGKVKALADAAREAGLNF